MFLPESVAWHGAIKSGFTFARRKGHDWANGILEMKNVLELELARNYALDPAESCFDYSSKIT